MVAAIGVGALASPLMFAIPAHADTTATVKARTQRMSDANLNSQQNGWYNPGDKVALVCSKRGQQVKGFFSFNIPGGWDNLWYRTSDNNFVADVDIETGTLDVVAPPCDAGGPAPAAAPTSSNADAAVARALSVVNTDNFGKYGCVLLVAFAYSHGPTGANSALELRDKVGPIQMSVPPPKGALVFSQSNADIIDGTHYGHVVIAKGDGTYISGGVSGWGNGHFVQELPSWNIGRSEYLGWAIPPW